MSEEMKPGKVLLVYLKRRQKDAPWGGAIKNVAIERIGDQSFVSGDFVACGSGNWADGRKASFAAAEIATMFEFENEDAYHTAFGRRRRRLRGFLT